MFGKIPVDLAARICRTGDGRPVMFLPAVYTLMAPWRMLDMARVTTRGGSLTYAVSMPFSEADDKAYSNGDEQRHPEVLVLPVHDACRENGRDGGRISHGQVEAAPSAGDHDHLAQAEERDECGELHREKDLRQAEEVGHGHLAEHKQEHDEKQRDR